MQKILILTGSGGNGLLQAAKAKKQQLLEEDPNTTIIQIDVIRQWVGKVCGGFGVNSWNKGMITGSSNSLKIIGNLLTLAEMLFWPKIFYHTLKILKKENFDRIIDTQPLGASSIIKAIRYYNKRYKYAEI